MTPPPSEIPAPSLLSREERQECLRIARSAIANRHAPEPKFRPQDSWGETLFLPKGAFVTLTLMGELRGCIGRMDAKWPLWETLVRMARQAAFADPRFDPVTPAEEENLRIEISVLTPPEPVVDPENEIVVGTHGILLETAEGQRGVLLPQVASTRNWDVITFLEHTCRKARLPLDAWRDSANQVFRFAAEVFGEEAQDSPGEASCEDGCG